MTPEKYRAIREDFFTTPLEPLEKVCLRGVRCRSCGETFFGHRYYCENCGSAELGGLVLGRQGTLFTYTVARYAPPGDYRGQKDPYVPFAIGSVELPEGLRVTGPLVGCDIDALQVGMPMELVIEPFYKDDDGCQVLRYAFKPAG